MTVKEFIKYCTVNDCLDKDMYVIYIDDNGYNSTWTEEVTEDKLSLLSDSSVDIIMDKRRIHERVRVQ